MEAQTSRACLSTTGIDVDQFEVDEAEVENDDCFVICAGDLLISSVCLGVVISRVLSSWSDNPE